MPKLTNKKIKSRASNRKSAKPEVVFRVIPKKKLITKKRVQRHSPKLANIRLSSKITTRWVVAFLFGTITLAIILVGSSAYRSILLIEKSKVAAQHIGYSKDTARRMMLIGSENNYPKEIANFQSAPKDLQEFVLKDYRLLKTSCIVNGNFAGPVNYKIVNVVYDTFARIEKNCNGSDSLILVKMSGIWTVVFSGNDLPECDEVNAFDIPQGISYNCRYGYIIYTNPNP